MSIPEGSFTHKAGRFARLRLTDLPMPDTFFFGNNVSVSGQIDVDLTWRATSPPVERGMGTGVPPDDWAAFEGLFAEASCRGRAAGRETGFHFRTGELSEDGFFAEFGTEQNGVFLT